MSNLYIIHYGVGHDKGGHSGRYPWGSGKNPYGGQGTKRLDRRATKKFYREMTNVGGSAHKDDYKIYKKWTRDISDVLGRNYTSIRFNPRTILEEDDDISAARVMTDPDAPRVLRERIKNDPEYKKDLDRLRNNYATAFDGMESSVKKWANQYDLTSLKKGRVSAQRDLDALIDRVEKKEWGKDRINFKTASDDEFTDFIIDTFTNDANNYMSIYKAQRTYDTQVAINDAAQVMRDIRKEMRGPNNE